MHPHLRAAEPWAAAGHHSFEAAVRNVLRRLDANATSSNIPVASGTSAWGGHHPSTVPMVILSFGGFLMSSFLAITLLRKRRFRTWPNMLYMAIVINTAILALVMSGYAFVGMDRGNMVTIVPDADSQFIRKVVPSPFCVAQGFFMVLVSQSLFWLHVILALELYKIIVRRLRPNINSAFNSLMCVAGFSVIIAVFAAAFGDMRPYASVCRPEGPKWVQALYVACTLAAAISWTVLCAKSYLFVRRVVGRVPVKTAQSLRLATAAITRVQGLMTRVTSVTGYFMALGVVALVFMAYLVGTAARDDEATLYSLRHDSDNRSTLSLRAYEIFAIIYIYSVCGLYFFSFHAEVCLQCKNEEVWVARAVDLDSKRFRGNLELIGRVSSNSKPPGRSFLRSAFWRHASYFSLAHTLHSIGSRLHGMVSASQNSRPGVEGGASSSRSPSAAQAVQHFGAGVVLGVEVGAGVNMNNIVSGTGSQFADLSAPGPPHRSPRLKRSASAETASSKSKRVQKERRGSPAVVVRGYSNGGVDAALLADARDHRPHVAGAAGELTRMSASIPRARGSSAAPQLKKVASDADLSPLMSPAVSLAAARYDVFHSGSSASPDNEIGLAGTSYTSGHARHNRSSASHAASVLARAGLAGSQVQQRERRRQSLRTSGGGMLGADADAARARASIPAPLPTSGTTGTGSSGKSSTSRTGTGGASHSTAASGWRRLFAFGTSRRRVGGSANAVSRDDGASHRSSALSGGSGHGGGLHRTQQMLMNMPALRETNTDALDQTGMSGRRRGLNVTRHTAERSTYITHLHGNNHSMSPPQGRLGRPASLSDADAHQPKHWLRRPSLGGGGGGSPGGGGVSTPVGVLKRSSEVPVSGGGAGVIRIGMEGGVGASGAAGGGGGHRSRRPSISEVNEAYLRQLADSGLVGIALQAARDVMARRTSGGEDGAKASRKSRRRKSWNAHERQAAQAWVSSADQGIDDGGSDGEGYTEGGSATPSPTLARPRVSSINARRTSVTSVASTIVPTSAAEDENLGLGSGYVVAIGTGSSGILPFDSTALGEVPASCSPTNSTSSPSRVPPRPVGAVRRRVSDSPVHTAVNPLSGFASDGSGGTSPAQHSGMLPPTGAAAGARASLLALANPRQVRTVSYSAASAAGSSGTGTGRSTTSSGGIASTPSHLAVLAPISASNELDVSARVDIAGGLGRLRDGSGSGVLGSGVLPGTPVPMGGRRRNRIDADVSLLAAAHELTSPTRHGRRGSGPAFTFADPADATGPLGSGSSSGAIGIGGEAVVNDDLCGRTRTASNMNYLFVPQPRKAATTGSPTLSSAELQDAVGVEEGAAPVPAVATSARADGITSNISGGGARTQAPSVPHQLSTPASTPTLRTPRALAAPAARRSTAPVHFSVSPESEAGGGASNGGGDNGTLPGSTFFIPAEAAAGTGIDHGFHVHHGTGGYHIIAMASVTRTGTGSPGQGSTHLTQIDGSTASSHGTVTATAGRVTGPPSQAGNGTIADASSTAVSTSNP